MDFADKFYAFGFSYTFQHGLAYPLFIEMSVDYSEVSASVFKSFGFAMVGGVVVALKVNDDWCPPVFGHYQIDYPMPVGVLCYLQILGVSYGWCVDYMTKYIRWQGFALRCCFG